MGSEAPTGTSDASQLLDGVSWAAAENARQGSAYYQKLDPSKVAVMGQSCGGVQALDVSKDPRVSTTVIWNSGVLADLVVSPTAVPTVSSAVMNSMAPMIRRVTRERLSELHGPIAYFIGGPSDVAYSRAAADFERIDHVPVLLANRDVGHYPATYRQEHGGAFAVVGTAWLTWQLKGDAAAARLFVGDDCGLCLDSTWTLQRKNMR